MEGVQDLTHHCTLMHMSLVSPICRANLMLPWHSIASYKDAPLSVGEDELIAVVHTSLPVHPQQTEPLPDVVLIATLEMDI